MTKEDFLSELRSSLTGSVSSKVINDNLLYYGDYIDTELRKGRGEEDIFGELGSPRLLARTIIETADGSELRGAERSEEQEFRPEPEGPDHAFLLPWPIILLIIFLLMGLIYFVIQVAIALLPVLIVVIVALLIARIIGGRR